MRMAWIPSAAGQVTATHITTGAAGSAQTTPPAKCCSDGCLAQCDQVTKRQVMETADDDFLEAGGLVVSAAAWHKKGIRVNTKASLPHMPSHVELYPARPPSSMRRLS